MIVVLDMLHLLAFRHLRQGRQRPVALMCRPIYRHRCVFVNARTSVWADHALRPAPHSVGRLPRPNDCELVGDTLEAQGYEADDEGRPTSPAHRPSLSESLIYRDVFECRTRMCAIRLFELDETLPCEFQLEHDGHRVIEVGRLSIEGAL